MSDFSSFSKFIRSKWFMFPAIILLAVLFYTEFNQLKNRRSVDREINGLKKQADALQKNNQQLSEFIEYFKTASYQEKVARQQLNLKKPGEVVYSFSEDQANISTGGIKAPEVLGASTAPGNPEKWLEYLFSGK